MSGLVKLVKKGFKKVVDLGKKVLKSKVFKVVAIAAAVVFTGGAALGALGAAGAGGGLMASLSAGFQAGLSALGSVGSALWTGVKAAGTAIKGFFTGAGAAGAGSTAAGATTAGAGAGGSFLAVNPGLVAGGGVLAPAGTAAGTAAAGSAATATGMSGLTKAALINTGGQMISGYAQGRQQEAELKAIEKDRKSRDMFGYDGHGNRTGDLIDPSAQLAEITQGQDPNLRQGLGVSLDQPPGAATPKTNRQISQLEQAMRDRLLQSLSGANMQPVGA